MFQSPPQTRRQLLRASACGGLSLSSLWRAQAAEANKAAPAAKIKACIVVFYYGGPSHLDTYDLKPNAPADVRGEFQPIASSAPGVMVSEHLPQMAKVMHKVAIVRSVNHKNRLHDSASTEMLTGRQSPQGDREEFAPIPQFYPCVGATCSYLWRDRGLDVPHAALPFLFHNVVDVPCQGGGFLGSAFDPLQITVDVEKRAYRAGTLAPPDGRSFASVDDRRRLLRFLESGLSSINSAERQWSAFYDKAYSLLGSETLRRALDLSAETQATRDRYGYKSAEAVNGDTSQSAMAEARPMRGQNLLVARRLIEAGVPFVNVFDFRQQGQNWDSHANNFFHHKHYLLPQTDQSLSALIEDLDQRGLLDSTLVIAMGEFGRTPRINANAGRDHWPDCYSVLLAGGGVKGGFVYGSSDRLGMYPETNPVSPADLTATIFSRFGLNPATEIHDATLRPHRISDGRPIRELFVS
ncbi:MAG: DUF1501 domain-containing protein [Planctomycetes bacterium]|nr:DUF1501 domain-containing protein [Planctomycetota bacterium]